MKLTYTLAAVVIVCIALVIGAFVLPEHEKLVISGLVQAREARNTSRFGGRVSEVLVKEGDIVKKGQVLLRFNDIDLRSRLMSAKASLEQARANEHLLVKGPDNTDVRQVYARVQQAEQNLRMLSRGARKEEVTQANARVQSALAQYNSAKAAADNASQMLSEGIISQQKYDDIQSQYTAAQSTLDAAKAGLSMVKGGATSEQINIARSEVSAARAQYDKVLKGAKPEEVDIAMSAIDQAQSMLTSIEDQLQEAEVKAQIDGRVNMLSVTGGDLVSPGRPVISIIDYADLWTDVYLPEDKLGMVFPGQKVKITAQARKGITYEGVVAAISSKSEFVPGGNKGADSRESSSFRVKVNIRNKAEGNPERLLSGMRVNVEFTKPRS